MKLIPILIMLVVVISAPFAFKLVTCQVHEHDYGVNTKWTLLSGCMIEVKPGVFVPEERYRGVAD